MDLVRSANGKVGCDRHDRPARSRLECNLSITVQYGGGFRGCQRATLTACTRIKVQEVAEVVGGQGSEIVRGFATIRRAS